MLADRPQAKNGLQHRHRGEYPQDQVLDSDSEREGGGDGAGVKHHYEPAVLAGVALEPRGGVVKRAARDPGLVVDGRSTEEVRVGLRCGEAGEVAGELAQQICASARVAAVQRDVRIARPVEMVVVQAMHDPVRAHGNAGHDRDAPAHQVVEPPRPVEPIVRRVVGEHEAGMLLRRDHDDSGNDRPRFPPNQGNDDGCGDDRESRQHRERRSHGIEAGELAQHFRRKHTADTRVVAKLLADGD